MKKLKLSELAHFAEVATAITVVVSLIYVGKQVEDNTAAIRSSTMQEVANASDVALQTQAANADLTRIRMKGDSKEGTLSQLEAMQYFTFNRGMWLRMQNIYAQQQLGVLEEGFWFTYSRIICEIYSAPGINATWSDHARVLEPTFVEYVESCAG